MRACCVAAAAAVVSLIRHTPSRRITVYIISWLSFRVSPRQTTVAP